MRISDWSSDVCSSDLDAAVVGVAPAAPGHAALRPVLRQRLVEGDDDVDRRGEPPLGGLFHRHKLVVQVEAQRVGVAGTFLQQNGRASCRERVCQSVYITVGRGSLTKKKKKNKS